MKYYIPINNKKNVILIIKVKIKDRVEVGCFSPAKLYGARSRFVLPVSSLLFADA